MVTSRAEKIAWATGIFEGEGCVFLAKKQTSQGTLLYGSIAIGMTDEDVIRKIRDIFGCGNIYVQKRRPGLKTMYSWRTRSRADFITVANLIRPMLGRRRLARLLEVESQAATVRRRPPKRRLCKRGHWLIGLNAKSNGVAKNGRHKIACRACVNSNYRLRTTERTGIAPRRRPVMEQTSFWSDPEILMLKAYPLRPN